MLVAAPTIFFRRAAIGTTCLHEKQAFGMHNPPSDKTHKRCCRSLPMVIRAHRHHATSVGNNPATPLLWPEPVTWPPNQRLL